MPNCDFYAAGEDFRRILDFVFDQRGWTLVELASLPDEPLRRFGSSDEVLSAYDLDKSDALMQLHAPEMGGSVVERPIVFRPGAMGTAVGRTNAEGWGLIQLFLRATRDGVIGLSHTNHNSQTRARAWAPVAYPHLGAVDGWNWQEVERVSRRLNHQVRRLAVDRSGSRVILPGAAERVTGKFGARRRCFRQAPTTSTSRGNRVSRRTVPAAASIATRSSIRTPVSSSR